MFIRFIYRYMYICSHLFIDTIYTCMIGISICTQTLSIHVISSHLMPSHLMLYISSHLISLSFYLIVISSDLHFISQSFHCISHVRVLSFHFISFQFNFSSFSGSFVHSYIHAYPHANMNTYVPCLTSRCLPATITGSVYLRGSFQGLWIPVGWRNHVSFLLSWKHPMKGHMFLLLSNVWRFPYPRLVTPIEGSPKDKVVNLIGVEPGFHSTNRFGLIKWTTASKATFQGDPSSRSWNFGTLDRPFATSMHERSGAYCGDQFRSFLRSCAHPLCHCPWSGFIWGNFNENLKIRWKCF